MYPRRFFPVLRLGTFSLFLIGGLAFGSVTYNLVTNWQFQHLRSWIGGANTRNSTGTFGTQGTGSTSNVPSARDTSVGWRDGSGNLWFFGGSGIDSAGSSGYLNDLWEFIPSTGQWVWIAGTSTYGSWGAYGTQGTGSTSNIPGARKGAISWTDSSGVLWLFGGFGYDKNGTQDYLDDLWKFNPTNKQWTWVSGPSTGGGLGTYGTKGTGSTSNIPGARNNPCSWIDSSGNLWLFGGYGNDSAGTTASLNDLWSFTPGNSNWTWVGGANTVNSKGTFGTQGTGSTSNIPSARSASAFWTDRSGNFWLFGGYGVDSNGTAGYLNDVWEFNPTTQQWVWISGTSTYGTWGAYGTIRVGSTSNTPGARNATAFWTDNAGNFWLFGGYGLDSSGTAGYLNDLWEFSPSNNRWTWIAGATAVTQSGNYGSKGAGVPANIPGSRDLATTVVDTSGNAWLLGGKGYDGSGNQGELNDFWRIH